MSGWSNVDRRLVTVEVARKAGALRISGRLVEWRGDGQAEVEPSAGPRVVGRVVR